MAPVIDLVDAVVTPEGVARDQAFIIFAKVTDGGLPAEGVSLYLYPWVVTPGPLNPGTGALVTTNADGFAGMSGNILSGSSSITEIGYSARFNGPAAAQAGAAPDVTFSMGAPGTNQPDNPATYFQTAPVLSGSPGDEEITWLWSNAVAYDSRIPIRYGISVSTGTPSASPGNNDILGTSFLSTGLTNGTTYNARIRPYLMGTQNGIGGPVSNIASAVPAAPSGADLSRVRYRVA